MHAHWFRLWRNLFENSFNWYERYTCQLFNPDIRICTDDDVVVMGDVAAVMRQCQTDGGETNKNDHGCDHRCAQALIQ